MAEFDRFAADYKTILDQSLRIGGEDSGYFANYKLDVIGSLLPPEFDGKILDFGCGVGLLTGGLSQRFEDATLHGFDVSNDSLSEVPEEIRVRGRFTSRLEELDEDYDLITVVNVMHHIDPPERSRSVQMLASRLRWGGRLVIIEHNPLNPLTRRIVASCPFDEGVVLLHPRETVHHLRGALLDIEFKRYIVFFPSILAALRPLEPRLGWLPLGAQYMISGVRHE